MPKLKTYNPGTGFYRSLFERLPQAVYLFRDQEMVYVNDAGIHLLSARNEQAVLSLSLPQLFHPDSTEILDLFEAAPCPEAGSVYLEHQKLMRLSGYPVEVDLACHRQHEGHNGRLTILIAEELNHEHAINESDDLSAIELKESQDVLMQFIQENRLLRMIAEGHPLQDILEQACSIVEERFSVETYALIFEVNAKQKLKFQAGLKWIQLSKRFLLHALPFSKQIPWVKAFDLKKSVLIPDILEEKNQTRLAAMMGRIGMRSCYAIPVLDNASKVEAVMAVFFSHPNPPGLIDLETISNLPQLLSVAVQKEKLISEKKQQKQVFKRVMAETRTGVAIMSWSGLLLDLSGMGREILHLDRNVRPGIPITDLVQKMYTQNGEEIPQEKWPFNELLKTRKTERNGVYGCLCQDDALIWISLRSFFFPIPGKEFQEQGVFQFNDLSMVDMERSRLGALRSNDVLTQLPNRADFIKQVKQAIRMDRNRNRMLSLLVLDLDQFKLVNEIFGHDLGDLLLKEIASRLKAWLPFRDILGRLGGDEFGILVRSAQSRPELIQYAENLIKAISRPWQVAAHELEIGCSLGISILGVESTNAQSLLRNADAAMYSAKAKGRMGYQFYVPDMRTHVKNRYRIAMGLRNAMEQNEFFLLYQPRARIQDGQISAVEALVRWKKPNQICMPNNFIPIAEETGFIIPLGYWVLEEACRQAQVWHQQNGLTKIRLAVNISIGQFKDKRLVSSIQDILDRTGFPAQSLELEITESMLMTDLNETLPLLIEMSNLGILLSIDDFGTGYSSLSYLQHFPIDILKVDRMFTAGIPASSDSIAITQAIIGLGRTLGMQLVVEGVETHTQLEFVRKAGGHEYQGYLLAKPLSGSEVVELCLSRVVAGLP
ncbi:MAG: EAL domain-containing protein [Pseudomonadota bacterium]|nr:EAL domain-containing protein [Pseudomonadota bacterium]